jgi:hypothetical protein
MQIEKFQDKWLFQEHSKDELKKWANQLRYFCFVRAWGGHNNDNDRFVASFNYKSKEDLLDKLNRLGIEVNVLPAETLRPIVGVSYTAEEFWKFKISVRRFPDLEQPGTTTIDSFPCHVYIDDNSFQISVSGTKDGNVYKVTAEDFEVCKQLEIFFDNLGLETEMDFEIEKDAACISRNKYPELFE